MKMLYATAALVLGLSASPIAAQDMLSDRATLERDVSILADDAMEGREAGADGYARAAQYVAGRFAEIGLQPGGDEGSWYQTFPLVRYSAASETQMSVVNPEGESTKAAYNTDFVGKGTPTLPRNSIEAPIVFVGYGLDLPEQGYDDLGSVDLEGAIALYIWGVPDGLPSDQAAVLQSNAADRFARHGAVGSMMVWSSAIQSLAPWVAVSRFFGGGDSVTWAGKDGVPYNSAEGLEFELYASPEFSRTIMDSQDFDYQAMNAALETDPSAMPSFDTGFTARVAYENAFETFQTSNVIGMLPGTDPSVAEEYVVVTAHLDHEGISPQAAPDADRIFNGAMDNATGVASIMETARLMSAEPGRRPLLFVALGAEELGLLGSSYHASNPDLENGALVANVNMDMPILTWPFSDIVAFGADRSNLLPEVDSAASEYGLVLAEDPNPEEMFFVRSDQYSYVRAGIPAVYVDLGFGNNGEAAQTDFLQNHYHKVSDETRHVDFEQHRRFTDVGYLVTRNIANMDARPAWNQGDYFGLVFGGPVVGE